MRFSTNTLKTLGTVVTGLGLVATAISGVIGDKVQQQYIDETVEATINRKEEERKRGIEQKETES